MLMLLRQLLLHLLHATPGSDDRHPPSLPNHLPEQKHNGNSISGQRQPIRVNTVTARRRQQKHISLKPPAKTNLQSSSAPETMCQCLASKNQTMKAAVITFVKRLQDCHERPCMGHTCFIRRSTNGRSTACRRPTSAELTADAPSTMPVRGLLNQSWKAAWLWKMCGMRKCISDHSSMRSFCSGVPAPSACLNCSFKCQHLSRCRHRSKLRQRPSVGPAVNLTAQALPADSRPAAALVQSDMPTQPAAEMFDGLFWISQGMPWRECAVALPGRPSCGDESLPMCSSGSDVTGGPASARTGKAISTYDTTVWLHHARHHSWRPEP